MVAGVPARRTHAGDRAPRPPARAGEDGSLDPKPVDGLPRVDAQGQGGLLDVAVHPEFARNGWIYWTYAQRDAGGMNGTELARGKLAGGPGNYRMEHVEVLFRLQPKSRDRPALRLAPRVRPRRARCT